MSDEIVYLAHLNVTGCSGRGVKYREISGSEHDKVQEDAAALVGPDAIGLAMRNKELRLGVATMLLAVTKDPVKDHDELRKIAGDESKWIRLTQQDLMLEGKLNYDKLFRAREQAALSGLFRRLHEISLVEVDEMVGKALPVAGG